MQMIERTLGEIRDVKLRQQTLDAVVQQNTCVAHRARVSEEMKGAIIAKLKEKGLLERDASQAGVFPPLKDDGGACPHLPLTLTAAPGSNFGGHHSYPGGLAVHESFNMQSAINFAANYRRLYGNASLINQDLIIAAPAWHDWAKMMVFQWNADGTEFEELNFGGTGKTDNYGGTGDSRTGAHHILSLAEAMARDLPPGLVITQASAHAAPSMGNEYKVVNWLRAAAIVARIDPLEKGYLVSDGAGHLRLPPLRHLADGIDFPNAGQPNVLMEYEIHNLSDSDFVESIPAVATAELVLKGLAKQYGYSVDDLASYNNKFRNIVLSHLGPERLVLLYSNGGLDAAKKALDDLRMRKLI
jgi:hypothetical protein